MPGHASQASHRACTRCLQRPFPTTSLVASVLSTNFSGKQHLAVFIAVSMLLRIIRFEPHLTRSRLSILGVFRRLTVPLPFQGQVFQIHGARYLRRISLVLTARTLDVEPQLDSVADSPLVRECSSMQHTSEIP